MKKFLLLVFLFGALKETMSLDVETHPELKEYLSEGEYHIHNVSNPVVADVVEDGESQTKLTVLVELRQGKAMDEVSKDYSQEVTPVLDRVSDVNIEVAEEEQPHESEPIAEEPKKKLSDRLVPELKELAKEKGIEGYKKMNKAELLQALTEKPTEITPKETPAPKAKAQEKKLTKAQLKRAKRKANNAKK